MQKIQGRNRVLLAMLAIGLLAAPALASSLVRKQSVAIVGADYYGSPNWYFGAVGTGKITKDPQTGIVVQIATACVSNGSGRGQCYYNLAYNIYDPWVGYAHIATSDSTRISKPIKYKSVAVLTACYNPHY